MPNAGIMASSVVAAVCTDVLFEPFNNLTAWTLIATNPTIVAGRTGTAMQTTGSTGRANYAISAPNRADTVTIGFAWKPVAVGTGQLRMVSLWGDANGIEHVRLVYDTATTTMILSRTGTSLGTSAAGLITLNAWHYVELQTRMHDTAGYAVVRINGVNAVDVSAVDTKNDTGTIAVFDTVRLGGQIASSTIQYDDLYLSTGSGCAFKGSITLS